MGHGVCSDSAISGNKIAVPSPLEAKHFQLPMVGRAPASLVDWYLDVRGLEWTSPSGQAQWMPFACIRRMTVGNTSNKGWVVRLSGPPGAIAIGARMGGGEAFQQLVLAVADGVQKAGCHPQLAFNNSAYRIGWLWARSGHFVTDIARTLSTGMQH